MAKMATLLMLSEQDTVLADSLAPQHVRDAARRVVVNPHTTLDMIGLSVLKFDQFEAAGQGSRPGDEASSDSVPPSSAVA